MQLVKIKTIGKDGKTYFPVYAIIDLQVNGVTQTKAVRIYTHKDDKVGFNTLSLASVYYGECASLKDYLMYVETGDDKYLHTLKNEAKK